jgi:ribokinase
MRSSSTKILPEYTLPERLNNRPIDVLALGSLITEQIIRVASWPTPGGQDAVPILNIQESAGGCAMNVSSFVGRLGGKSAVVSTIGDGKYAQVVWDELSRSGVDTQYLSCHKNSAGNLVLIMTNTSGDWVAMDYLDPVLHLQTEDIPSVESFSQVKIVHIDGFSYQTAGGKEPVIKALQKVRQAGCVLSVDASVPAAKTDPGFLEELFRKADIVFANVFEILSVTKTNQIEDAIQVVRKMGPKVCVIKNGAHGSWVVTLESVELLAAFEVDVVDTIAAGDAYVAATLFGLSRKIPLMKSALYGNAAGALACMKAGSLTNRFSLKDIENLILCDVKRHPDNKES